MPLSHIEHLLVTADDIDATRDWYARVLGMTSGPHPEFGFPVHWMYLGGVVVELDLDAVGVVEEELEQRLAIGSSLSERHALLSQVLEHLPQTRGAERDVVDRAGARTAARGASL